MTDEQNGTVRARAGFFNRDVRCDLTEAGLEIRRNSNVTRIGYAEITEIRYRRHGPRRSVLSLKISSGMRITLKFISDYAAASELKAFVKSLLRRVAGDSPATRFVLGASQSQWVASWFGVFASGAVLAVAARSLLTEGQFSSILLPVGIALVNLAVVVPILQSGRPRRYRVKDAPFVFV
jgi:hypothetical protein